MTVHIPADVDRPDRVLAGMTTRQLAILAAAGLLLYGAWTLTRSVLPLPVFPAGAIPLGVLAAILAFGQRDGLPLDRVVLAAIRQHLNPRHQVAAPEGVQPAPPWLTSSTDDPSGRARIAPSPLRLPADSVDTAGVVNLGADGLAIIAVASTINFALRTAAEQEALVASFARYLHSLTAPVQVLVRTERVDLSTQIAELRERAGGLPHPALEAAALEHADYLAQLGQHTDLLRRQILLILREPVSATPPDRPSGIALTSLFRCRTGRQQGPSVIAARRAAESRLVRRLHEATELLGSAGIVVTPLDTARATTVLASSCNPDTLLPPTAQVAAADQVITTSAVEDPEDWDDDFEDEG